MADNNNQAVSRYLPVDLPLSITKTIQGGTLQNQQFAFGIFDENGNQVASAHNNADGTVAFPPLHYTEPGVHHYTVKEVKSSVPGWSDDGRSYPVTVTVAASGANQQLVATPAWQNGYAPTIVNKKTVQAQIQATKQSQSNVSGTMVGHYTFNLITNGQIVGTAVSDDQGNIIFPPVTIDRAEEMDYIMVEVPDNPPKPGWSYDTHQCIAHVSTTIDPITGLLTAKVTYNPQQSPNFRNGYTCEEASVGIKSQVIGHGKTPADGAFEFDLVDGNGNVVGHAHNDANGNIVFPDMNLAAGDYDYKIIAPPDGNGWAFDKKEIPVHVHVTDNKDGTSTPVITYPADPNFNATYTPAPAKQKIVAHKVLIGWALPTKSDQVFTFVLKDAQGNVIKRIQAADGDIDFGEIDLTQAGAHGYTISEEGTDGGGWTLDKNAHPLTVTVTDDGQGQLTSSVDTAPTLRNIYLPTPASTGLDGAPKAMKAVSGGSPLKAGQFTFGIFDDQGNLISTGSNDAAGNILFPAGTFRRAGTYRYTIRETTPDGGGYVTDKASYPYQVVVTDDGHGQLHADITQPTPMPIFTNTYTEAGSQPILAYKSLQGWTSDQDAPTFTFTLKDSQGQVIKTVQSSAGTLDFGTLQFTQPGDYDYTVNEELPLPAGWSTPVSAYRVRVHMEDAGGGKLIATVTYPDGNTSPQFVNTYAATPANVGSVIGNNPSGQNPTKTLTGGHAPLKASQFRFGLYDANGNLVSLGFNDANGRIRFPVFFVSRLGESNYTMREVNQDGKGIITDKTSYPVKVTVTDNGQGQHVAAVSYPGGTPAFHNHYQADDASATIDAKVIGNGKTPDAGSFEFDVVDSDGQVVGKATNDANGDIVFPALSLPEGDHDFTILAPPDGKGWTFDVPSLPVHIHVDDNGDGTSTPTITYPGGDVFNPTYTTTPANIGSIITHNPSGQNPVKTSFGAPLNNDEFSFGLYDADGRLAAVGFNDADGNIRFPTFFGSTPGDALYTMKELTLNGNGWTTDERSYPVHVAISDDGSGQMVAAVTYPEGTPTFLNYYNSPASQSIVAHKTIQGWNFAEKQFDFTLKDENGQVVKTVQNAGGVIDFGQIEYTEPGTYTYTIEEDSTEAPGWRTDSTRYRLVVTVVPDGHGHLVATVSYPDGDKPVFENVYTAEPTQATIQATKMLLGAALSANQFRFGLFDENGEQIATAGNDGDGRIAFPEMAFTQPGVFHYTVRELNPASAGWVMDKRSFGVTVTVTDDGQGRLTANVQYDGGKTPVFLNRYTAPRTLFVVSRRPWNPCGQGCLRS
jgi:pilin isopeptide linkage protein